MRTFRISPCQAALRIILIGLGATGLSFYTVSAFATETGTNPKIVPEKCRFSVPTANLECGQLNVKLDRSDARSSARIDLSYVIIKSRSSAPANDPVVFLTGGPGSSALFFLNVLARSSIVRTRDLIVIEQRGNGYSEPNLLCSVEAGVDVTSTRTAYRKCFEDVRARNLPLRVYNLGEAARDLVDLMTALKIKEWNILGTSYGSFWALEYLRLKPQGIRSAILDSPYPPQADPRDSGTAHLNGLTAVFDACAKDPRCNRVYPNLRNRFIKLVTTATNESGGSATAGSQVLSIINRVNFETTTVAYVPRLISALERNDTRLINAITSLDPYVQPLGFDLERASSTGLFMNTSCIEDVPFASAPESRIRLSEIWPTQILEAARLTDATSLDYCNGVWEVEKGSAQFNQPVTSNVPVLITVGALDPETPPFLGEVMKRTLYRSTLVVLPDSAHAAFSAPSECSTRVVNGFLKSPDRKPNSDCFVRDRPRFSLPGDPITLLKTGR
jgi:pimeloyl-ACP methyl ester carboxylesterase